MIVVAAKSNHSKAANTSPAILALHGPQLVLPQSISPNKLATAINPANQKIMVMNSAANIPNLCAAAGKRIGATTKYATARSVHTEVKMRKLTEEGDQNQDQLLDAYASRPRMIIARTPWIIRIGRMKADISLAIL